MCRRVGGWAGWAGAGIDFTPEIRHRMKSFRLASVILACNGVFFPTAPAFGVAAGSVIVHGFEKAIFSNPLYYKSNH